MPPGIAEHTVPNNSPCRHARFDFTIVEGDGPLFASTAEVQSKRGLRLDVQLRPEGLPAVLDVLLRPGDVEVIDIDD